MVPARTIGLLVLTLALAGAALSRTAVFRDEFTYWTDAAARSPRKARPLNNLGGRLLQAGRRTEALPLITRALEIDPGYLDARFNLAILFYDSGLRADAAREFREIVARHPGTKKASFSQNMLRSLETSGVR